MSGFTVTWPGLNGRKHVFEHYAIGTAFYANKAGVYIFCYSNDGGRTWWAVYVGETEDFNSRLNLNLENHHRWDAIAKAGATHICVLQVSGGKTARSAIETELRNSLNPRCNLQSIGA